MTAKEITQVVNSYIKEYRQYNISEEQIFKDIYKTLFEFKTNDLDSYYIFDNMSYKDQADILHNYLNKIYNNDFIEESFLLSTIGVGLLTTILTFWFTKTDFQKKLTYSISKNFQIVINSLNEAGKSWILRYQIIKNNSEKCYRKCGVDINRPSDSLYTGTGGADNATPYIHDFNDLKRGECMTECFIDTLIESIKLLFLNYIACLKQTNQYFRYENLSKMELESIIGTLEIDGPCENFRDDLNKAIKLYYDIIAYRYKEESNYNQKLLDYRKRLADALFSVKNSREQPNKKIDYNKK